MTADTEVRPGRAVHRGNPVTVDRYTTAARINHWITAACLVLLALSGLALFHPSLFFLTALFGGGEFTRIVHPWIGVVMLISFAGLFLRFWRLNLWHRSDSEWIGRPREVLAEGVRRMMIEVDPAAAAAGALVLFRMKPRAIAKHVGIITDPGSLIHAYERLGVIEEPLSSVWRRSIAFAFLFPRPSASVRKQARRKTKS